MTTSSAPSGKYTLVLPYRSAVKRTCRANDGEHAASIFGARVGKYLRNDQSSFMLTILEMGSCRRLSYSIAQNDGKLSISQMERQTAPIVNRFKSSSDYKSSLSIPSKSLPRAWYNQSI
jgi:hypothetical protein